MSPTSPPPPEDPRDALFTQVSTTSPSPAQSPEPTMITAAPVTMTQTPTSSSARVFGITELMEMILLEVDPIQLFALQRVNNHCKEIIAESKDLQKRMLLDPEHGATTDEVKEILGDGRIKRAMYPSRVTPVENGNGVIYIQVAIHWTRAREGRGISNLHRQAVASFDSTGTWTRIVLSTGNQPTVLVLCDDNLRILADVTLEGGHLLLLSETHELAKTLIESNRAWQSEFQQYTAQWR
ncbi:hypothetical protein Slin15195_G090520 [Septoria linicola]|uniref:F-box domain-containing protein n=1 Tax=Septoria linicola TaxID=215465 RepID=A0A9Q9AYW8_9PEZI|nr:hypothetical protein Slin15195_G090520 [Septoria linicola]